MTDNMVRQLTDVQKSVILALNKEGFSVRKIANKVQCSHVTVLKLLKKYLATGSCDRKKGTGLKNKKTTDRNDRTLKNICLKDRKKKSKEINSELLDRTGIQLSYRTVKRRLQSFGLSARRPRKKPTLTAKMRTSRLNFAKVHRNWTENDWKKVIFTDESKCNLNQSDGLQYIGRRVGEDFHKDCIIIRNKFPLSFMVWGCISYFGPGDLVFCNGSMNSDSYINIIQENLIPSMRRLFPVSYDPIFQDDSAPCHRSRQVHVLLIIFVSLNINNIYYSFTISFVFY